MIKNELEKAIIALQRELIEKKMLLSSCKQDFLEKEQCMFNELFDILDAFSRLNTKINKQKNRMDTVSIRFLNSFILIEKKLKRLLLEHDVHPITFENNIADPNICEIIETVDCLDSSLDGKISKILRTGYIKDNAVLRHAQVITYQSK